MSAAPAAAATFEVCRGRRATQTIWSLDDIEPELLTFIRGTARWLDPFYPQRGARGAGQRGQWTQADGAKVSMMLVEEFAADGRGIRITRLLIVPAREGGVYGATIRLEAIGLVDAKLVLQCDFAADEQALRGTLAALTVQGPHDEACLADFRMWFAW